MDKDREANTANLKTALDAMSQATAEDTNKKIAASEDRLNTKIAEESKHRRALEGHVSLLEARPSAPTSSVSSAPHQEFVGFVSWSSSACWPED